MSKITKIVVASVLLTIIGLPCLLMTLFVAGRMLSSLTYGSEFTKTKPNSANLVGLYLPNKSTLKMISKEGHYASHPMSILLSADGTFQLSNIPDWWQSIDNHGQLRSMSGTWRVEKNHEGWYDIELSSSNYGTWIDMIGEHSPYKLSLGVGDPDHGQAMIFENAQSLSK